MPVLEVKDLYKVLKKKEILHKINFSVKTWEIYGFLWPNGAWKTTTMKSILGFLKPDSWEIRIFWGKKFSIKDT